MGIKEHTSYLDEFNNLDVAGYAALHPELFAYVKDAMAQPGKQYLLIGDTNHFVDGVQEFLNSPALAALLKYAGTQHACIERVREIVTPARVEQYRGTMNEEDSGNEDDFWNNLREDFAQLSAQNLIPADRTHPLSMTAQQELEDTPVIMAGRLLGLSRAGLRVTAADSLQWKRPFVPGYAERMFLGDREVASYIEQQAQGEKTAVIYGASHFRYNGSLRDRLGADKCACVEIFPDEDSCVDWLSRQNVSVDMLPDKIYFLKEKTLTTPADVLYGVNSFSVMDDAHQRWKYAVAQSYGVHADAAEKSASTGKITKLPETDPQWFDYKPGATP